MTPVATARAGRLEGEIVVDPRSRGEARVGETAHPPINRNGGLDAVRFAAAALVFVSHAAPAAGVSLTERTATFGPLGVGMFFVLSGYLIPTVWARDQRPVYFVRRFARIMPAYWFAVIGVALVTGHALGLEELAMLQPLGLPDSLLSIAWTLRIELVFYALVPLLALLPVWAVVALGVGSFAAFESQPASEWLMDPQYHFWRFVPGMVIARFALPRLPWSVAGLGLAVAVLSAVVWRPVELGTLAAALLVAFAVSRPLSVPGWVVFGSTISYGIYLWHADVLAMLKAASLAPAVVVVAGVVVTLVVAAVSWFLVERPALDLVRARRRSTSPLDERGPVVRAGVSDV